MLLLRLLHYSAAVSEVERGVYACGERPPVTVCPLRMCVCARARKRHTQLLYVRVNVRAADCGVCVCIHMYIVGEHTDYGMLPLKRYSDVSLLARMVYYDFMTLSTL